MSTVIDSINREYKEIVNFLQDSKQPSLSSDVNKYFKKLLALSIGSYFEHEIQQILVDFVTQKTQSDIRVISFLKKKAISKQYHTYFSWGEQDNPDKPGKNANTFFSLFGDDFKREVETDLKMDISLDESVKAFIELGHLRNIIVHSNIAAYPFENKTSEELYALYKKAAKFVTYLKSKLLE